MFFMTGRLFTEARSLRCGLRLSLRTTYGYTVIIDVLFFRVVVGLRPHEAAVQACPALVA